MSRIALLAAVAFAALTGTAHAGGWATVELGEAPSGLVAGKPWQVELIVKQHGVTPMEGVTPSVRIANADGVVRTFQARPASKVGHYVAEVVYPAAGEWNTRFFDGFTDVVPHRLSPVTVTAPDAAVAAAPPERRTAPPAAPAPAAAAGDAFPWPQAVMIAIVALLFVGGILATFDRPRVHVGTFGLRGRAA
jgi:hypothetical protein